MHRPHSTVVVALFAFIAFSALSLGLLPAPAKAGPWTKSLGQYYAKLSLGGYFASGFRDASGTFQSGVDYASISPAVYAEVGVFKNLQLSVYAPYLVARNTFDGSATNLANSRANNEYVRTSMGDTIVAVQWSSPWWSLPHALRFEAKLPLYNVNAPRGGQQTSFPAPGDGQVDWTLWGSIGKSFESLPLYLAAELGHQFRTEQWLFENPRLAEPTFSDSLRWFGQAGLRFLENKYAMLNFTGVEPYSPGLYTKGWMTLGLGLFYPVGKRGFALEANADQALRVVNTAKGSAVGIGVSYSK
jgi:hypothetical protein